jgi:hypothetical protein
MPALDPQYWTSRRHALVTGSHAALAMEVIIQYYIVFSRDSPGTGRPIRES